MTDEDDEQEKKTLFSYRSTRARLCKANTPRHPICAVSKSNLFVSSPLSMDAHLEVGLSDLDGASSFAIVAGFDVGGGGVLERGGSNEQPLGSD